MKSGKTESEFYHLWQLAAPAALVMAANMAMQIVDTMFVGRLGAEALGGVAVGNAYFINYMIVGLGFTLGLDFRVSHAYGAGRYRDCHVYLVQALYLITGISLVSTTALYLSTGVFSSFGVAPNVALEAQKYLQTLSFSLLPMLASIAFNKYLQAMGVGMPILWMYVAANLVNAFSNWIFVWGNLGVQPLGVAGAGLSTCCARLFLLAVVFGYTLWRDRKLALGFDVAPRGLDRKAFFDLIKLGFPASMQMLLEVGVFATSTMLIGRIGAIPLAAHQIVLQIASFTFMMPLGLSSAAAVRVGQALGRQQFARARKIGWLAIAMGVGFMAASALTLLLFASPILRTFTTDTRVVATATGLLLVAALFQLSDGVQVVSTGVLRGIGNTRSSMFANFGGHWLLGLPIGYALCFSRRMGAQGLWIGLSIGLTSVALTLLGVWAKKARAL